MKIKKFTYLLLLSVILSGLMAAGYVSTHDKKESSKLENQNQATASESYTAASISKGTILFLLAVGVIGFLGVSRKRKEGAGTAQENKTDRAPGSQDLNAGK